MEITIDTYIYIRQTHVCGNGKQDVYDHSDCHEYCQTHTLKTVSYMRAPDNHRRRRSINDLNCAIFRSNAHNIYDTRALQV